MQDKDIKDEVLEEDINKEKVKEEAHDHEHEHNMVDTLVVETWT